MVFTAAQMGYGGSNAKASSDRDRNHDESNNNNNNNNDPTKYFEDLMLRKSNSPTIEDDFTVDESSSSSGGGGGDRHKKSYEDLILRKTNSPTIEDDFTVDLDDEEEEPFDVPSRIITPTSEPIAEEEPFDEPQIITNTTTPKAERTTTVVATEGITRKHNNKDDGSNNNDDDDHKADRRVDAEIDMMSWSGSEFDVVVGNDGHKGNNPPAMFGDSEERVCNSSRSRNHKKDQFVVDQRDDDDVENIVWSGSELEDDVVIIVDQRDDTAVKTSNENIESRERSSNDVDDRNNNNNIQHRDTYVNDSVHAVLMMDLQEEEREPSSIVPKQKRQPEQRQPKENLQSKDNKPVVRLLEVDEPRTPETPRREATTTTTREMVEDERTNNDCEGDENSAFSVTPSMAPSVAVSVTKRTRNTKSPRSARPVYPNNTETTERNHNGNNTDNQTILKHKHKEEDLLDRFFDNIESRVCVVSKRGERTTELTTRAAANEENGLKRLINPFLDQLERFDSVFEQLEEIACPEEDKNKDVGFKERACTTPAAFAAAKFTQLLDELEKFDPIKAACQQQDCNEEDLNAEEECSKKSSSVNESPFDILEKAYQRAESKVKKQKRTSFEKKDQLHKMKEQWNAARLRWKLKQSIVTETLKKNTNMAAKTTTKYVDNMVSSCHPSMTSAAPCNIYSNDDEDDKLSPVDVNCNGYVSENDEFHDALSIDNSDFISMMSPSEHSNIHSSRRNFRSSMHNAASDDEMSYSDHVLRSPSSKNGDSIAGVVSNEPSKGGEGKTNDVATAATIGVATGPLAVINEEVTGAESNTSDGLPKRGILKKKDPSPTIRRWAYPGPSYYNGKGASSMPSNTQEWLEKWKDTVESVYSVSERILDRAQCASETLNFADSNSFEDDHEESRELHSKSGRSIPNKSGRSSTRASAAHRVEQQNSMIEDEDEDEDYSVSAIAGAENPLYREESYEDYSVSAIAGAENKIHREESYEDYSVSAIAGAENKSHRNEPDENSACDDDDLSGFESALNTMDGDHSNDERRPPMLRLMQARNDSRSCGSDNAKSTSVHSRLSTEVPEGYTLADSIRHASLSSRNNVANRSRVVEEPRGNKLKNEPSAHVRSGHLIPPKPPRQDLDSKSKDQQRIRSPRSSETNDTSDMTAVTASSSDVFVSHMVDSTHSKRSMAMADSAHSKRSIVIHLETPKVNNMMIGNDDNKTISDYVGKSTKHFTSTRQQEPPVDDDDDDDGDKGTVFSYNTTSTDSTEFKDCYQDTIPTMSTMGTLLEDETHEAPSIFTPEQIVKKEDVPEGTPDDTAFLPSDKDIVKSMALLSVSATVLKATEKSSHQKESEKYEVESVPSASSYSSKEEIVEDPIVVESNVDAKLFPIKSSRKSDPKASLVVVALRDDENNILGKHVLDNNPKIEHNNVCGEMDSEMAEGSCLKQDVVKDLILEEVEEHSEEFSSEPAKEYDLPVENSTHSSNYLENDSVEEDNNNNKAVVDSDEFVMKSLKDQDFGEEQQQPPSMDQRNYVENHHSIEYNKSVYSDELFLKSLKDQDFLKEQPSMDQQRGVVVVEGCDSSDQEDDSEDTTTIAARMKPTTKLLQGSMEYNDDVLSTTSTTRKVLSTLREPRSVEDRRRRRLRQRRKFDKVLRGETDDSSSMSSSTMSFSGHQPATYQSGFNDSGPLISASFDTGFGTVPVIEESR